MLLLLMKMQNKHRTKEKMQTVFDFTEPIVR